MGIDGLLQAIKPVITPSHISNFANKKAAIDVMGWLYRGAYSCAYELAIKKPTTNYLIFVYRMLSLLKRWSITPIICIDGLQVKAKDRTLQRRTNRKHKEREKGLEAMNAGNHTEARKAFTQSIRITKKMIYKLIDMLASMKIEFIVAPYEADAQVAYLCRNGYADFAISEDSDLLCYNCPVTIYKLGQLGECEVVDIEKLRGQRRNKESLGNDYLNTLFSLTESNFTYACILAGCDYLPSVKGMGLKKAMKYFDRFRGIESIIGRMRIEKVFMGKVPDEYVEVVKKVGDLFLYQLVYDPVSKTLTTLHPHDNLRTFVEENKRFVGEWISGIEDFAKGKMDLKTFEEREYEPLDVETMLGLPKKKENAGSFLDTQYLTGIAMAEVRKNPIFSQPVTSKTKTPQKSNNNGERNPKAASQQIQNDYLLASKLESGLWNDDEIPFDLYENAGFDDEEEEKQPHEQGQMNFRQTQKDLGEEINFLFDLCKDYSKGFNKSEDEKSEADSSDERPNLFANDLKESLERIEHQPTPLKDLFGKKEDKVLDSFQKVKSLSQKPQEEEKPSSFKGLFGKKEDKKVVDSFQKLKVLSQKPQEENKTPHKEDLKNDGKKSVVSATSTATKETRDPENTSLKRKFAETEANTGQGMLKFEKRAPNDKEKEREDKTPEKIVEKELKKVKKNSPPGANSQSKLSLFFGKPCEYKCYKK